MDILTLIGMVLGGLLVGACIYHAHRNSSPISLVQGTRLFLSATGFVAGIKIVLFAFDSNLSSVMKQADIEPTHIVLGGLALCWVSVLSVIEVFKRVSDPADTA